MLVSTSRTSLFVHRTCRKWELRFQWALGTQGLSSDTIRMKFQFFAAAYQMYYISTAHNHVIGSCTAWVLWCSILIWHTSPIIICHLLVFVVILHSSTAEDKAINWKALELPLASQIKGLAILQEEGGEVSRCMAGFISHASRVCIEVFEFTVWWSRRLWVILGTKYIYNIYIYIDWWFDVFLLRWF